MGGGGNPRMCGASISKSISYKGTPLPIVRILNQGTNNQTYFVDTLSDNAYNVYV